MKRDSEGLVRLAVALSMGCCTAFAPGVRAQAISPDPELQEIERRLEETMQQLQKLKDLLADEQRRLDADRRALEQHRQRTEGRLDQITGRGAAPSSSAARTAPTGQGASGDDAPARRAQAQQQQQAPKPQAQQPSGPVGEAPQQPERPAVPAQIFDEPTALTPRGKFVLEPAYQYVHSTDNRIALVGFAVIPAITIGLIDVRRVSRDIHTLSLTGRYGLTNRWELEAKVPWVSASSSTITRPLATPSVTDQYFDSSGSGIGDVEVAARYQLNQFRGDNAVWIGYLRYKSRTGTGVFEVPIDPTTGLQSELPTGSGFDALQPGFTVLYPSDPAVFFGGAAYLYSFERDVGGGYGTVQPGGVFDFNLGMGLALNERASFSIGYQHSIVGSTDQRDPTDVARVLAQQGTITLGTMRFGLAYRVAPKINMNLSLGVGVTDDSPDFEATIRFPYAF